MDIHMENLLVDTGTYRVIKHVKVITGPFIQLLFHYVRHVAQTVRIDILKVPEITVTTYNQRQNC